MSNPCYRVTDFEKIVRGVPMRYGVPYQGSKNFIASRIVNALPKAGTLVDLFAGGCAITHAAMVKNKYNHYIANDLGSMPKVFLAAIYGAASDRSRWFRWISRDEFIEERKKLPHERDLGILSVWSFGNNLQCYLYARELEDWKHALWNGVVDRDYTELDKYETSIKKLIDAPSIYERRIKARKCLRHKYIEDAVRNKINSGEKWNVDTLFTCTSLERLQSLQSLQSLQRLRIFQKDYRTVEIPKDSVVYCDPPYANTCERAYANMQMNKRLFDHETFWEWVRTRDFPVYVSEYTAPKDFVSILKMDKRQLMGGNHGYYKNGTGHIQENLFLHERFAKRK